MWDTCLYIVTWVFVISVVDFILCTIHRFFKPLANEYITNTHHPSLAVIWSITQLPFTSVRWFQLHSVCNWFIVIKTWREFLELCMAPNPWLLVLEPTADIQVLYFASSLHIYHVIFWSLKPMDILHHATSVFLCGPLMIKLNTKLLSWHLLIGTGIPGGIDYALLTLVKYECIPPLLEKRVNAWLNAYVRAPFGVIGSFLTIGLMRHTSDWCMIVSAAIVTVTTYWNATYFAKRAVESYAGYRLRTE